MKTLRDVILVGIALYGIIYFTTPTDTAQAENILVTPGGDTIWVPDSTVYHQYKNRRSDTSRYKAKWVDISN